MSIIRSLLCLIQERLDRIKHSKDLHLENPVCFCSNLKSSGFSLKLEGFTKLCFHNNAGNGLVLLQSGKRSILGNFKSCHREECHPLAGHRSVGCFGHGTQWKEETLIFIQLLL